MRIDFYKYEQDVSPCKEFGLYDAGNNTPAILDSDNPEKWEATVECNGRRDYKFIAVDNVRELLQYKKQNAGTDTCDAILRTAKTLCFVELKNQAKSWFEEALCQLETTIKLFKENHDINIYSSKRAYAVNKTHPHFHYSNKEKKQRFYKTTEFVLECETKIKELK